MPVKSGFRSLYRVTILAFIIVVFIAFAFLNYIEQNEEKSEKDANVQKVRLIKIDKEKKTIDKKKGAVIREEKVSKPDEIAHLNKLGIDAYNAKEFDKAFIHFYQAYSLNKSNRTIRINLYNTLLSKGDAHLSKSEFKEAVDIFKKCLEYVRDDYKAHQGLGLAYSGMSDYETAVKHLQAAYKLNPEDDRLKYNIAMIYNNLGKPENAQNFMKRIDNKSDFNLNINLFSMATNINPVDVKGKVETKSSHFNVYYDGNKDPVAGNLVSLILEEVYYSVGRELNFNPPDKVTAILYTNQQFNENIAHPDWSNALFDGKIKLPAGGLKDRSQKLTEVLTHEYTHAVIFAKVRNNCPTWLNEGLAQILSGTADPPARIIASIVRYNKLPDISTLELSFINLTREEAIVAYSVSMLFTRHLINTYGMNFINTQLDDLSDNVDMRSAFKNTYYVDVETAYNKFIAELKSKHGK